MYRRQAVKTVDTILHLWKSQQLPQVMDYWYDPKNHPDVYNLLSYKILSKHFDKQDGRRRAAIAVEMTFGEDNFLPNNESWIFELERFDIGWKVTEFYLERAGKPQKEPAPSDVNSE